MAQILSQIEFTRSTEHTLTSAAELLPVLERVREQDTAKMPRSRRRGSAASRCRYSIGSGWRSPAEPLFPTLRFSEAAREEYVALLHVAARRISEQQGYHDYPF